MAELASLIMADISDPETEGGTLTLEGKVGSDFTMTFVPAPVANFSADPTEGYAPLTVQFTDLSTNTPTSWLWDFGDGETSTEENPEHTYNEAGIYTVTLTATNGGGSDDEVKEDYITVLGAPVADFSAEPLSGKYPLQVHFTDLSE